MDISNNLLLYGPPGTGKTYNTVNYAVAIIEGRPFEEVRKEPYSDNLLKYDKYTKMGRITFMTFHQSLGYDDFIEGIKPIVAGEEEESLVYRPMPSIFYDFCRRSEFPRSIYAIPPEGSELIGEHAAVWIHIPGGFGDNVTRTNVVCSGSVRFASEETVRDIATGDILVSMYSQNEADAIGVVIGKEDGGLISVKWMRHFQEPISTRCLRISSKEMVSAPCKCEFVTVNEILALTEEEPDGKEDGNGCVFIIDEINRGNISKIFGEMITLLESSRRKGMPECLEVWLPQMKTHFSIPQNVYVLGTMNTADKSLATIDTALRRRFEFVEMMPDPSTLMNRTVSDINLGKLLAVINERIELLYDREHMIGHAYFLSVRTIEQLAQCFIKKIIPLLQEYFFDDYENICWVLGSMENPRECPFVKLKERSRFQLTFDLPDVYEIEEDMKVFLDPQNYLRMYEKGYR